MLLKMSSCPEAADQLMTLIVEPYGLWLLLRNPSNVDVEQDDAAVGLLLTLSVVRFTCWLILLLLLLSC